MTWHNDQRILLWSTGDDWIVLEVAGSLLRGLEDPRRACGWAVEGTTRSASLDIAPPGLWLWEGRARQPDKLVELEGAARRLTEEESRQVVAGRWFVSESPRVRWAGDSSLDNRGKLALAFAADDVAAWDGEEYDEVVRRLKPFQEDAGVAFRVEVSPTEGKP